MKGTPILLTLALFLGSLAPESAAAAYPVTTVRLPIDSSTKSPVVAGALSFLVPFGAGSFYAGHMSHGVRHLTISAAALLAGGIANDRLSRDDAEVGSAVVFTAAAATFLVNWIWGTVAAVGDAQAFNRRNTVRPQTGMSLRVAPLTHGSTPSNVRIAGWVQIEF